MFKTNPAGHRYLQIVILQKDSKYSCSTPLFILCPNQSQGFKEVLTRVIILYHFACLRPSKLHWNWHNLQHFSTAFAIESNLIKQFRAPAHVAPEGPFLNPSPAPRRVAICPTNGFVSTFFPNIYHRGALCLEWPASWTTFARTLQSSQG